METKKSKASKNVRTGQKVFVITGNDRGKTGVVKAVKGDRIVVEGVNVRKKHIKRSQNVPTGRIIDFECPIHVSNVKVARDQE